MRDSVLLLLLLRHATGAPPSILVVISSASSLCPPLTEKGRHFLVITRTVYYLFGANSRPGPHDGIVLSAHLL
uniref:Putative secreted protein n=1 Tax=Amblyomma triste TaxID=251400 RepID=A0A023G391_AMBTT